MQVYVRKRVAAVDCGTNSIRLLVADVDGASGALRDVERRMEVVRLGQGVDVTRRLDPAAVARTLAMCQVYAERCRELEVDAVRFVATSATRDAAGREEFFAGVRAAFGVDAQVISGEEEAHLAFIGATSAVSQEAPGPYLVVDLGGGSTELVLGESAVEAVCSMNVGCVRMTERHLHTDPPTAQEIAACMQDVDRAISDAAARVPLGRTVTLVGVAGSITTVTAAWLGLESYQPQAIDGAVQPLDEVEDICQWLLHLTRAERAALPFMHPGRVDVMGGGAVVWSRVIRAVRAAVASQGRTLATTVTSEHDMLDGIALSLR